MRCTGHCCTAFFLPIGPKQLQESYARWNKGTANDPLYKDGITPESTTIFQDIHLVAPMVTYLGFFKKSPLKTVNPSDNEIIGKTDDGGHYYSCKHFDPRKRACTIYEIRPRMCHAYPYGKKCKYDKCTWTGHKEKKLTRVQISKRRRELKKAQSDPGDKIIKKLKRYREDRKKL